LASPTPFCIGLAGPSCAGKTSIARRLKALLPGEATGLEFATHSRVSSRQQVIEARDFLVVEGLFIL
jgi:uridine kinase